MAQQCTVFGYGPQGQAQALNLRDAGWKVEIGVRPGPSWERARADGFAPHEISAELTQEAHTALLLIADDAHATIYSDVLCEHLPQGALLSFAHGFSVHYGAITPRPDLDIALTAPMCPGASVRSNAQTHTPTPIITAVHQDSTGAAQERLSSLVDGFTNGHADIIPSSFAEETETNLFAEQALLIGGLSHLILATFDTMVDAGYNPKLAYYWCLHDMRDCANLFASKGLAGALEGISRTARHGGLTRGPRIITDSTRSTLQSLVQEIRAGTYAQELADTCDHTSHHWRTSLLQKIHDEQVHAKQT